MGKADETRKRIKEVSSHFFMSEGIGSTSMEDLAAASGYHRRTLYRYYPRKEDLLLDLVNEKLGEINAFQRELFDRLEGGGLERFEAFLRGLVDYMTSRKEMVRFLDEFDYFYSDGGKISFDGDQTDEFRGIAHETEALLLSLVTLGREDRSIRLDHDPGLFVSTVTTLLWGAAQKAAVRGDILEKEYELSLMDMVNCQIDLYVKAIDGRERS